MGREGGGWKLSRLSPLSEEIAANFNSPSGTLPTISSLFRGSLFREIRNPRAFKRVKGNCTRQTGRDGRDRFEPARFSKAEEAEEA